MNLNLFFNFFHVVFGFLRFFAVSLDNVLLYDRVVIMLEAIFW